MNDIFRFPNAQKRDPAVDAWFRERPGELGTIAKLWFHLIRQCGDDVRELLHDGHPTACVGDAAFSYVNVFSRHVNLGFYQGADLADPNGLLIGTGKRMRHVKLQPDQDINESALKTLVHTAYQDMHRRITKP